MLLPIPNQPKFQTGTKTSTLKQRCIGFVAILRYCNGGLYHIISVLKMLILTIFWVKFPTIEDKIVSLGLGDYLVAENQVTMLYCSLKVSVRVANLAIISLLSSWQSSSSSGMGSSPEIHTSPRFCLQQTLIYRQA